MEMQKFKITDELITFGPGAILGLDTKQERIFSSSIQELEGEPGIFKVTRNLVLRRGMIAHAPTDQCKSISALLLGAPRKYREPDPVGAARTDEHFARLSKFNAPHPLHRRQHDTAETAGMDPHRR